MHHRSITITIKQRKIKIMYIQFSTYYVPTSLTTETSRCPTLHPRRPRVLSCATSCATCVLFCACVVCVVFFFFSLFVYRNRASELEAPAAAPTGGAHQVLNATPWHACLTNSRSNGVSALVSRWHLAATSSRASRHRFLTAPPERFARMCRRPPPKAGTARLQLRACLPVNVFVIPRSNTRGSGFFFSVFFFFLFY